MRFGGEGKHQVCLPMTILPVTNNQLRQVFYLYLIVSSSNFRDSRVHTHERLPRTDIAQWPSASSLFSVRYSAYSDGHESK
jgi:hypothetical protein